MAEERDRIAALINDVLVRRLFSAGLSLETALGLLDGHRAADEIQLAIIELDEVISALRTAVFGWRVTD